MPSGESASRYHGKLRAHHPLPGKRQRDPRGVDRDPATAPLLGDEGRRAGAARRVEDQIARIGST